MIELTPKCTLAGFAGEQRRDTEVLDHADDTSVSSKLARVVYTATAGSVASRSQTVDIKVSVRCAAGYLVPAGMIASR